LKVAPFVVTLGMMGVARGIAQSLSGGSRIGFAGRSPAWVQWAGAIEPEPEWLVIGPAAWNVILLAVVVGVLLRYTILGRHCYAIGSNEATARLCGIRVERTKVILYTLAGLLTGLAGVVQVARNNGGSHDAQAGLELEVIAAVVIGGGSLTGGEGSVMGSIIGALIMNVLENGCSKLHLPQDFRYVLIGGIIIGVAALNSWRQRRLR
jgi:ribose transport system permease protein